MACEEEALPEAQERRNSLNMAKVGIVTLTGGRARIHFGCILSCSGRGAPNVECVGLDLPGKSRGTFDNVSLSGGPYDPTDTTQVHG